MKKLLLAMAAMTALSGMPMAHAQEIKSPLNAEWTWCHRYHYNPNTHDIELRLEMCYQ